MKVLNIFKTIYWLLLGKDVRSKIDEQSDWYNKSKEDIITEPLENIISKPMLGTVYQDGYSFDEEKIIKALEDWESIRVFKEYCKNNKITENRSDVKTNANYNDQTEYNLKVIASDLLYKLTYQDENHYHKLREDRIEEWKNMKENSDARIIDGWRKEGRLCPKCKKAPTKYGDHGLVKIVFDYTAGGPIGGGIHISGTGSKEYQFHYKKCTGCDYWEMVEYREVPSWWDDLWGIDCPFHKGDIIEIYRSGNHGYDKFKSYEITRW